MTALTLSPVQRQSLKGLAHGLNPTVIIGDAGLTPAVLKEIDRSLSSHELIKVRMTGDDRAARIAAYDTICNELHAAPVQHIGKLLVIFRPTEERELPPAKPAARGTTAAKKAPARGALAPPRRVNAISGTTANPRRNGRAAAEAEAAPRERPNRTERARASGQRSGKKPFQAR